MNPHASEPAVVKSLPGITLRSHQARLLACYERVADATRGMLDAARAYDWTSLGHHGRDCETWMQRIEALPSPETVLDREGRRRRLELLQQVLRDDAALCQLLGPAFGRVDRCLQARPPLPPA
jgi:hypothetical protein